MAEVQVPFPNADKVSCFIEAEKDPVVRSLMRLVYGNFLRAAIKGERPVGAIDVMYCFNILSASFHQKEALANALKGDFGDFEAGSTWGE
jgi:hypothetical protein